MQSVLPVLEIGKRVQDNQREARRSIRSHTLQIQRVLGQRGLYREGVRTLREAGLLKVKQGYTTLEEIISCTNH